jgi:hypothetical protein
MEVFVAGGFPFIFIIIVPLIFIVMVQINFVAFDFYQNVWSIGLILTYGNVFYATSYAVYIFMIARQIPTNMLILSGLIVLATAIHTGVRRAQRTGPSALPARGRA